ncbi:MAG: hypothetical protein WCC03_18005 [Candidatus Acidiferrales bacterium]
MAAKKWIKKRVLCELFRGETTLWNPGRFGLERILMLAGRQFNVRTEKRRSKAGQGKVE